MMSLENNTYGVEEHILEPRPGLVQDEKRRECGGVHSAGLEHEEDDRPVAVGRETHDGAV